MLLLLIAAYLGANFLISHSPWRQAAGLFFPFFLAIVTSNWLFLPPGPTLHLTPESLRIDSWGLLIRPRQFAWREVEAFGIEHGNLWLLQRDKICWRFRPDNPNSLARMRRTLPGEPPGWDRKLDNIYGDSEQVMNELESWRRRAAPEANPTAGAETPP